MEKTQQKKAEQEARLALVTYYRNETNTLHVKVDPVNRKIIRLKTGGEVNKQFPNAWRLECVMLQEVEQWQIDEIRQTLKEATHYDFERRRALFLTQIEAQ